MTSTSDYAVFHLVARSAGFLLGRLRAIPYVPPVFDIALILINAY